jgi:hypothetical protein
MSFNDSFETCMARKHLPVPSELFSGKTVREIWDILEEIHGALENAGGAEITLAGLGAVSGTLGLSADGLKVVAFLAAAGANIAAQLYFTEAFGCWIATARFLSLFAEIDSLPDDAQKQEALQAVNDNPGDFAPA